MLSLGEDGHPVQRPVAELAKLRGDHVGVKDLTGSQVLPATGDTVEISAVFEQADQGLCGLRVRRSEDGTRSLAVTCQNGVLDVFGTEVTISPEGERKRITLQVFLDIETTYFT